MSKFKLTLRAKAQVVEAPPPLNEEVRQSLANASEDGLDQDDLLHIRSTLVTSGANRNHDVFLKDELWKARYTPLHKPSDWNHKRTQIVGHIYNVEARTIDGRELDMEADEPTLKDGTLFDGDFELIVDEVVYATLLPEYAATIRKLAKAGKLSVSMEAWFDDFDLVLYDKKNEDGAALAADLTEARIIGRSEAPDGLEDVLKSADPPGPGKTKDGEFVGRVLLGITFGGKGYVGVPANPRSEITKIGDEEEPVMVSILASSIDSEKKKATAVEKGDGFQHRYVVSLSKFESEFFDEAQVTIRGEVKSGSVEEASRSFKTNVFPRLVSLIDGALGELGMDMVVQDLRHKTLDLIEDENRLIYSCYYPLISRAELERRESAQEEEEKSATVMAEVNHVSASTADTNQEEAMNADQLQLLQDQLEKANADLAATKEKVETLEREKVEGSAQAKDDARVNRVDALFRSLAAPAEIARIDRAIEAGEDPFEAKLQWLFDTRAQAAQRVEELEGEVTKHTGATRIAQVKALELYTGERLAKLEPTLAKLSEEEFEDWMSERKELAEKIKAAAESAAEEPEEGETPEKATAALDEAKPEEKPKFAETNTNEETKAGAEEDSEEEVFDELAKVVSKRTSPRLERLRKERGDHFGRL